MEDEPLEEWAARREERRPKPGERHAVPLGEQPQGAHVDPDAPRCIQEWDGHQWAPAGVAEDRAAAADETSEKDAASRAGPTASVRQATSDAGTVSTDSAVASP
ncbi:DUF6087 family protein [Streptomyces griseoflavus]|uniref:DUF6087 family protein n=1 Tax=Streptomyces griseoflavus TaxID=35619 RepID=UPI00340EA872